jgi:hypothetical protein
MGHQSAKTVLTNLILQKAVCQHKKRDPIAGKMELYGHVPPRSNVEHPILLVSKHFVD